MRRVHSVRLSLSSVVLAVALGIVHHAHAMPGARRPDDDPFASTIAVSANSEKETASCLGVMVAPRVALTAGHCVSPTAKISVRAATVGGSTKVVAVDTFWFDPTTNSSDGTVDLDSSDVAILVLAEPLAMPAYVRYARRRLDQPVEAVGIRNRATTIQAMEIMLRPLTSSRYYASAPISAPGDSGSPVFVGDGDDRTVVGVLAGSNTRRTVFARVDVVADKLDELVLSTSMAQSGRRSSTPTAPPRPTPRMPPSPPAAPRPRLLPRPFHVRWT